MTDETTAITYPDGVFAGPELEATITGTGSLSDPITFTIKLTGAALVSQTITFEETTAGTVGNKGFFTIIFQGTGTAAAPWTGIEFTIRDTTEDKVKPNETGTAHPSRAHIHRGTWNAADTTHFDCAGGHQSTGNDVAVLGGGGVFGTVLEANCDTNPGKYDMIVGLQTGQSPLTNTGTSTAEFLKLHDED